MTRGPSRLGRALTVRSLMVLVLVFAVLFGSYSIHQRGSYCRVLADYCASRARERREQARFQEMVARELRRQAEISRARATSDPTESGRANAAEAARFYDEQERTASGWAARASVEASRLAATASAFDRVAERPWLAIPPRPE